MNCFTVLIKIKNFYPKIGKIPFDNFICIFSNGHFEGRISLMQYEYQYINQEIKDINSDISYKINVVDYISKKLIATCVYTIPYNNIKNINIGNSINFINQEKLLINQKIKKDLFDNSSFSKNIYLIISTEIIKFNKNNIKKSPKSINSINLVNYNKKNNIIKNNNMYIYNPIKFNKDKNNFNQIIKKVIKKNRFEYIKIKKIKTNNKNKNNSNYENKININDFINIRSNKKYNKNKNKLETNYKREYAPPILLTEEDKKNINLNMHNICVQNYYTITSPSPIDINTIKKRDTYDKNKIYEKKDLQCHNDDKNNKKKEFKQCNYNKLNNGIKRNLTYISKVNKNKNKNENNLNINNYINYHSGSTINKKRRIIDYYNKEIYKKNKNKNKNNTKDKEKSKYIIPEFKEKEKIIDRIKSYRKIKSKNFLENDIKTNNIKIDKKNICTIKKNYSSVDKIRNSKNRHNNSKIHSLFNNSKKYFQKKNIIIKKNKPFITNLSAYLNSIDNLNLNYNMTFNSSYFLKKNIYNKRFNFDKYENIISQKSQTLRENSNGYLNKRLYNNNNLNINLKNNYSSSDEIFSIFNDKNSINEKPFLNSSLKRKSTNYISLEINYKDKIINILEYNILLCKKLKKLKNVYKKQKLNFFLNKEKILYLNKKKNIIQQKMNINKIKNYIHVNINCQINNKIIPKIKKIKEKEINIYQNIFNIFIDDNDIFNQIKIEQIQKINENRIKYILLELIKNIVNIYGNITQIFNENILKKKYLLFLLLSNEIELNNINFYYSGLKFNNKLNEISDKYKCKEIKEETENEEEDNNEDEKEKKLNISIKYKNDNIIDKILLYDFPNKYKNITDKKFIKLNSNEYIFNNEIKVYAYYKDEELILQKSNNDSSYDIYSKEYSLDEFISEFIKNKNKNKKNKYLSPVHIKQDFFCFSDKGKKYKNIFNENNNKKKKYKKNNLSREKYSRNHKIINDIEFNEVDFKRRFFDKKILLSNNNSFLNYLNNSNNIKNNKNDININTNSINYKNSKDKNENNND